MRYGLFGVLSAVKRNAVRRLINRQTGDTMTDLVERLRNYDESGSTFHDAIAEIKRLQALHLERTKSTHKALCERDEKIERLQAENERLQARIEVLEGEWTIT